MFLERLTLRGIGPFAALEEIDFAAVSRSGLFLLEGPTGSGKSTVIDAICFALYGGVAAATASTERIASHHLGAGDRPEIDLVFSTARGRYRVVRRPEFVRPKSRGAGVTTEKASQALYRLTGEDDAVGELLCRSAREIGDEILDAVGLSREQFVKTVVLPQGEFANLLRAKAEDKARLLEKLFAAGGYRTIQDELKTLGEQALARRAEASATILARVDAFAGAVGVPDGDRVALRDLALRDDESARREVDRLVTEQADAAERSRADAGLAAARRSQAEDAWRAAVDVVERAARRAELQATAAALAGRAASMDERRAEADAARRAAVTTPSRRAAESARSQLAAARVDLERARAGVVAVGVAEVGVVEVGVVEVGVAVGGAELDPGDGRFGEGDGARFEATDPVAPEAMRRACAWVADRIAERQQLMGAIAEPAGTEASLDSRRTELSRRQGELAALDAAREEITLAMAEVPSALEILEVTRAESTRAAALLPARIDAEGAAAARCAAIERADAVRGDLTAATREVDACRVRAAAAADELTRVQRARIDGIAGELGLGLVDGDPCPVCGSPEHPAPAQPDAGHVDRAAVEAADRANRAAHRAFEDAAASASRLAAELAGLDSLTGGLDAAAAQAALDRAAADVAAARAAQRAGQDAELEIESLRTSSRRLQAQAEELARRHTAIQTEAVQFERSLAADESAVEMARGGYPTVADRRTQTAAELTALTAYGRALDELAAAGDSHRRAELAAVEAITEAGFDSEDQARAAGRETADLVRIEDDLRTYAGALAEVRSGLADPALNAPELDRPAPDVAALAALAQTATELDRAAAEAAGTASAAATRAAQTGRAVSAALRAHAGIVAETADAIRVGQIATGRGENERHIELTNYVLIRRFREVVEVANEHLQRISSGRYALAHSDTKRGNAKAGLDLIVLDHETDKPRDIATLSGGETFYVSLAMALALAEVVQSEQGGLHLGTLFIDEGFGSLDPQTLDAVMRTLDGLRSGGRVVGVVSHVSDLKRIIGDRIEVRPRGDGRGSRIRVVA